MRDRTRCDSIQNETAVEYLYVYTSTSVPLWFRYQMDEYFMGPRVYYVSLLFVNNIHAEKTRNRLYVAHSKVLSVCRPCSIALPRVHVKHELFSNAGAQCVRNSYFLIFRDTPHVCYIRFGQNNTSLTILTRLVVVVVCNGV